MAVNPNRNVVVAGQTIAGQTYQTQPNDKPKIPAKFWMNIGVMGLLPNNETGELEDAFIAMNGGIPLDLVQAKVATTKDTPRYIAEVKSGNELTAELLEIAKALKPGERQIISKGELFIEVYAVKEPAKVVESDPSVPSPFRKKFIPAA